jgi:hypothetical protein
MRTLSITLAAVAALALSSTFAATEAATTSKRSGTSGTSQTSTTSHTSTTGLRNEAPEGSKHGATNPHFCPPGQAKKPGKGSAFHC